MEKVFLFLMAKFQKKSELVEAIQFNPDQMPWPEYIHPWPENRPVPKLDSPGYIFTPEQGKVLLMAGDWIVTDEKGKRTICKPDVFEAVYEEVI